MARGVRRLLPLGLALAVAAAPRADEGMPTVEIAEGVHMPVLSIGTGGLERSSAADIVRNWLALGHRGIDTALMYGDQDVIAQVIEEVGVPRDDLFLTSKVPGCSSVRESVEADLAALKTDYLDLLLIHFPQNGSCVDAWGVLEEYHAKGTLKSIGVSNFLQSDLEPILRVAKVIPAVNQIRHNVLSHDDQTIAFCQANNITIEAYSPLGRSSGEIPANPVIQSVAAAHNVSTYQVALKWILQHGHILTFQSVSMPHQQQDADVFSFTLTDDEMATLDKLQAQPSQAPNTMFA